MRTSDSRRRFLKTGGLGLGAAAIGLGACALGLGPVGRRLHSAGSPVPHPGYGPLAVVRDRTTGLPLLRLPHGFEYTTFGWAGEPLAGDFACPAKHDGMGVVGADGDVVTLVRNHEVGISEAGSFAPGGATWDPACGGGTVTLRFDTRAGKLLDMRPSLSGTVYNCAGGVTPWGSWLSCEEVVLDRGESARKGLRTYTFDRPHGFVFEVPGDGVGSAEPLVALGQFRHEAACVDPATGIVYLTEDVDRSAGFYRMVPSVPGDLRRGGRLQMLQAVGAADLRRDQAVGTRLKVQWVDIAEPGRGRDSDGGTLGVQEQGFAGGGSRFTRLEGIVFGDGRVHFTSTNGGDAGCGQLWAYAPGDESLQLVYESPGEATLDYPDNIVLSPRGGMVICEDSDQPVSRLYGMTKAGGLFEFCRSEVVLDGVPFGFEDDYRGAEWAGCCFSPDGRWLFANFFDPGFSVAITGPWRDGLI